MSVIRTNKWGAGQNEFETLVLLEIPGDGEGARCHSRADQLYWKLCPTMGVVEGCASQGKKTLV